MIGSPVERTRVTHGAMRTMLGQVGSTLSARAWEFRALETAELGNAPIACSVATESITYDPHPAWISDKG
jgi:hypothetical protein